MDVEVEDRLPDPGAVVDDGAEVAEAGLKQRATSRARFRMLAVTALVGVVFLATVSPYLHTSKERFGRWFYNVNTSIYMWADSWDEVKQIMSGTKNS